MQRNIEDEPTMESDFTIEEYLDLLRQVLLAPNKVWVVDIRKGESKEYVCSAQEDQVVTSQVLDTNKGLLYTTKDDGNVVTSQQKTASQKEATLPGSHNSHTYIEFANTVQNNNTNGTKMNGEFWYQNKNTSESRVSYPSRGSATTVDVSFRQILCESPDWYQNKNSSKSRVSYQSRGSATAVDVPFRQILCESADWYQNKNTSESRVSYQSRGSATAVDVPFSQILCESADSNTIEEHTLEDRQLTRNVRNNQPDDIELSYMKNGVTELHYVPTNMSLECKQCGYACSSNAILEAHQANCSKRFLNKRISCLQKEAKRRNKHQMKTQSLRSLRMADTSLEVIEINENL